MHNSNKIYSEQFQILRGDEPFALVDAVDHVLEDGHLLLEGDLLDVELQ